MHPHKRRRINETNSVLSKPFKSPLKTSLSSPTGPSQATPEAAPSKDAVDGDHTTQTPAKPSEPAVKHARKLSSPLTITSVNTITNTTTSSDLPALLRHQTPLVGTLTTARATLDTHTQALTLESSPHRTATLGPLTLKWRNAAREAAEEVYAKTRDRVNKMGGMQGLKEREERQQERRKEWEKEEREAEKERRDLDRERVLEEERERREEQGGEERGEGVWDENAVDEVDEGALEGMLEDEEAERMKKEGRRNKGEGEGYSMGHMLRDLKIEFEIVGWDEDAQRWAD